MSPFVCVFVACLVTTDVNVVDFGAKGDGKTLSTKAFQSAIDFVATNGGGNVLVDGGIFVIGTIVLRTGVYLMVLPNGVVLSSWDVNDFPLPWPSVLIRGFGINDSGIIGGGVIDGQAVPFFVQGYDRSDDRLIPRTWEGIHNCSGECRPRLVEFINSTNILIRDVTLQNSPDWTSHFLGCRDVLVDNITVVGDRRWPNNDGIDPDSSVNVLIQNSYVDVGDDGVCLKSTRGYGPLRNVTVQDCQIRSRSSGVKLGSSSWCDMTQIRVQRVHVWDSNRGIGIQHRDLGNISDVVFRDIVIDGTSFQPTNWWGQAEAIWVSTIPRTLGQQGIGHVSNIQFINITARGAAGVFVSSRSVYPITNIGFEDVRLNITPPFPFRQGVTYFPPSHDYRPTTVSPSTIPAPIDGFFFENGKSCSMVDCGVASSIWTGRFWGQCITIQESDVTNQNFACDLK